MSLWIFISPSENLLVISEILRWNKQRMPILYRLYLNFHGEKIREGFIPFLFEAGPQTGIWLSGGSAKG